MTFNVIAGDFPSTTEFISSQRTSTLRYVQTEAKGFRRAVHTDIVLVGNIAMITVVTEENKKAILGSVGWGTVGYLVGGIVAAPLAIAGGLAGLLKGGNKKEICFICHLKDGKKFMAVTDPTTYMEFTAISMMQE